MTEHPPATRRSFRFDSVLTAGSGFFLYGLAAVTGPLLARNLGPEGRGNLTAVLAPAQMIGWLLCFGLPWAAAYYVREHHHRHLIMSAWVFAIGVGGVVAAVAWWFAPSYLSGHDPRVVAWFRAFVILHVVFVPVTTALDLLMARGALVAYNLWRAFPLTLNAVFIIGLALSGRLTLSSALVAAFASNAVWFVGLLTATRAWPGRGFRRSVFLTQLHYGARVIFGNIGGLLVARLDQVLLVGLVAPSALGYYAVAVNAASFLAPIAEGLAAALFPRIRHATDTAVRDLATDRAIRWTVMASVFTGAGIAATAPWVLPLLFGSAFHQSLVPLWIMIPGQVANNTASVTGAKLLADGRPGMVSWGLVIASVVTIIGLALTVSRWGITAAAWVTTASQFAYLGFVTTVHRHRRQGARIAAADDRSLERAE